MRTLWLFTRQLQLSVTWVQLCATHNKKLHFILKDHHSKLIQHLTDMLNETREDTRNKSREQSTALELAQNSTLTELLRVGMLVNSTQTILLTKLKKVHENMTEKVSFFSLLVLRFKIGHRPSYNIAYRSPLGSWAYLLILLKHLAFSTFSKYNIQRDLKRK